MRACILLLCLLGLQACAADTRSMKAPQDGSDSLCTQDCLGNGGTQEFCTDRCTY